LNLSALGDVVGDEEGYFPLPATYLTVLLFAPKPLEFLELAFTLSDVPVLISLIVQEVFKFTIVQVLPPAVTLLPVIFEPPFFLGRLIFTVTLTNPFLGEEETMETIVGADGFVIVALAWTLGATARLKTRDVARVMV
jgi:hypothetical protein